MVVRMRKVMAMKRSLHVCFSAGNWYCYKVATIAKKFTWSWDCYKIRLSADNFKTPTQPRWARSTSSPGLFPQKMGGAPPNFWGKSPGDEVEARHGCAILVFRLQTPARKCEIINCLPVWWGRMGGRTVRSVTWLSKISRMEWQPTFLSYNASLTRGAPLSVTYYTVLP